MADSSQQTALSVKVETVSGTFDPPNSTTDLVPLAELRPTINGITVDNPEYTGSINAKGPALIGETIELSGRIMLRGPGALPTADSWTQGRIIRAAGFTESILSAAVPVAAEALGVGSTTTMAKLGSTPAGTLDLYKAMALHLVGDGATPGPKTLSLIRAYSAAKEATLAETRGAAPTGNYQIPAQLAYFMSGSVPPTLSVKAWFGGTRFDINGMAISSFKINLPAAGRDSSSELPSIEFTLTGEIQAVPTDEACPTIPAASAIPSFRDGKMFVAGKALGGSSLSIDLGADVAYPPNPNRSSGSEAGQLVRRQVTGQLTLNQVRQATMDFYSIAKGQGSYPIEALFGLGAWNTVGVIVTDARFNHQSPDNSGNFVTTSGEFWVDGVSRDVALVFPGW